MFAVANVETVVKPWFFLFGFVLVFFFFIIGLAFDLLRFLTRIDALLEQLTNHCIEIDGLRATESQVVAAAVNCVARMNNHTTITAGIAGHFEAANNTSAEQMTVVQPVLLAHVVGQQLQVVFSQQLSGEETRTDYSLRHTRATTCTTTTARSSGGR